MQHGTTNVGTSPAGNNFQTTKFQGACVRHIRGSELERERIGGDGSGVWSGAPRKEHGGNYRGDSLSGIAPEIQGATIYGYMEGLCKPIARHDEVCGLGLGGT